MGRHRERHQVNRLGWIRAAVLGANDGLLSTASLVVGVAASGAGRSAVLMAGIAGLTAGALSMAAGEFVSVSSQADSERADLEREARELEADPAAEHAELAEIYQARGLDGELARTVAHQLMEHDALGSHARDELGLTATSAARPIQAAGTSAMAFALGATGPLLICAVTPLSSIGPATSAASLVLLGVLGGFGAALGGAPRARAVVRVVVLGGLALLMTAGVGRLVGAVI